MLKTVGFPSARTGDQTIVDGSLVIATTGEGIDFSANTPAAGMTSQLLNGYEEGTFTPVVADAATGGNTATCTAVGRYTRIGNRVHYNIAVVNINTTGLTASNPIYVRGLPFTSSSTSNLFNIAPVYTGAVTSTTGCVLALIGSGSTVVEIIDQTTGGGVSLLVSAIASGFGDFYFTGSYQV